MNSGVVASHLVPIRLYLVKHARASWREVVRPWLEQGREGLNRNLVLVPTRGQAAGWKQQCVREKLPLLGVEFLTPALARKKWLQLSPDPESVRPAIGRELLLLGLRFAIQQRIDRADATDPLLGFWRSLLSDPERALNDFDELLRAGLGAENFVLSPLRDVFAELVQWAERLGYAFAPRQNQAAAQRLVASGEARIGDRMLLLGLSVENWPEFFNLAALARRCLDLTVVLPVPAFRGQAGLDEHWVKLWTDLLGVEPEIIDESDSGETCETVASLWTQNLRLAPLSRARIMVGRSREDEVHLVVNELVRLVREGADHVAVILPQANAFHLGLLRLLEAKGLPVNDLLGTVGSPPVDTRLQRGILEFQENGGRLEDLMAIWPVLFALNLASPDGEQGENISPGEVRRVCERLFDLRQTHALSAYQALLDESERDSWRAMARISRLLSPWPQMLTVSEAVHRFSEICTALHLELPVGWETLGKFAERELRPLPLRLVTALLNSFLPEKSPPNQSGQGKHFAPVTLTTLRRAEGLPWSHVIFVESNAGVWPMRRESSCWLTDAHREKITQSSRYSLGVFTADQKAVLEKNALTRLCADTSKEIIFSAATIDAEDPETQLVPNAWLERVLWNQGHVTDSVGYEEVLPRMALAKEKPTPPEPEAWARIHRQRVDPGLPFDDYFFSGNPDDIACEKLAARQIEAGLKDPVSLWFEAVLNISRVEWTGLQRARKKSLGTLVHHALAHALRPGQEHGRFGPMPSFEEAGQRLQTCCVEMVSQWPDDCYWESFGAELRAVSQQLLDQVYQKFGDRPMVAAEVRLPKGATLPLGEDRRLLVTGYMDLVLSDRAEWNGAHVDVVDFKTGSDKKLSAKKVAASASSMQLCIYLAAARSLGVSDGHVWMLKPNDEDAGCIGFDDLSEALAKLQQLRQHLETGRYGALTADRSPYAPPGFIWPVACVPVRAEVLKAKFKTTFGDVQEDEEISGDE